jgi:hypothetical protein
VDGEFICRFTGIQSRAFTCFNIEFADAFYSLFVGNFAVFLLIFNSFNVCFLFALYRMFIQAFPPNYEQFLFAYLLLVISKRNICIHTCYAILFLCAIFKYFSCSQLFSIFIIQNCSSNIILNSFLFLLKIT